MYTFSLESASNTFGDDKEPSLSMAIHFFHFYWEPWEPSASIGARVARCALAPPLAFVHAQREWLGIVRRSTFANVVAAGKVNKLRLFNGTSVGIGVDELHWSAKLRVSDAVSASGARHLRHCAWRSPIAAAPSPFNSI